MEVASQIKPSAKARQLFNQMVNRADEGVLSLEDAIGLGVERSRQGEKDPGAASEINELVTEEWIGPDQEGGGWLLH